MARKKQETIAGYTPKNSAEALKTLEGKKELKTSCIIELSRQRINLDDDTPWPRILKAHHRLLKEKFKEFEGVFATMGIKLPQNLNWPEITTILKTVQLEMAKRQIGRVDVPYLTHPDFPAVLRAIFNYTVKKIALGVKEFSYAFKDSKTIYQERARAAIESREEIEEVFGVPFELIDTLDHINQAGKIHRLKK